MYDDVTLQAEEGTVVIAQNALEYTPRGVAYYEVRYVINIRHTRVLSLDTRVLSLDTRVFSH